ncbi:MAG: ABC transporter permease [Arthrobacter sp.]|uniref:ABC transporter permease n=1 Tax=unclassified Arthrobacter TaxID=235627 RepID=UPI00264CACC0|nr:ABC transporter permease [Micrococcaceae bacterium]MDN5824147.1 ABC transporter permease [Micrococcaceae bacterium]MDN5879498.1 ABC transporter permease [Micrococcaceae bacterium]MDN5904092.1 ABC transporter permease [Micrococcaceae bacterium]MDN6201547.1 ABC transporter permease [Micrococcaceae bacterium]
MSTATTTPSAGVTSVGTAHRNWSTPMVLAVLALVALLGFAIGSPSATARFRISTDHDAIKVPDVMLGTTLVGWIGAILLLGLAAYSFRLTSRRATAPKWLVPAFAAIWVIAFLVWVIGSANNPNVYFSGLIAGSFTLAIPLIFGSLSGVLCERTGVINIAIEGQLLAGAFGAAVVGSITQSLLAGVLAAVVASMLVSAVLAVFSIKYMVNQIIVGVVLNVLVAGLTSFLFSTVMKADTALFNSPPSFHNIRIPGLADIPVFGPIFFDQTILGYGMYVAVFLVWFGLFKTRWGLRVRAVGEHPQAADTVGIRVKAIRFSNVLLAGVVAGLGGAFFTLVTSSSFSKEMTAGQGFIALAAMIFGRWNPIGAFFASLLFGFSLNLSFVLSILGTPVPNQFMQMLPYIVTIFAVAGLAGKSRPPASNGVAYVKE